MISCHITTQSSNFESCSAGYPTTFYMDILILNTDFSVLPDLYVQEVEMLAVL
jgi:hypothetical protein